MAGRFDSLIVASAAAIFKQDCPGFYRKMQDKPIRKSEVRQAACRYVAAARVILLEDLLEASEKTILQKKEKILKTIAVSRIFLELLGRFELPTSSLPMTRSTD